MGRALRDGKRQSSFCEISAAEMVHGLSDQRDGKFNDPQPDFYCIFRIGSNAAGHRGNTLGLMAGGIISDSGFRVNGAYVARMKWVWYPAIGKLGVEW